MAKPKATQLYAYTISQPDEWSNPLGNWFNNLMEDIAHESVDENNVACDHPRHQVEVADYSDGFSYTCLLCDKTADEPWELYDMTREEWCEETPAETYSRTEMGQL